MTDVAQSIENGAGFQGGKLLKVAGEFEEQRFIGDRGDELQADGQAGFGEAAGNGNGGNSGEVCRAVQAQEKCARGVQCSVDGGGFLADGRGCDGRGGDDEGVNLRIFQSKMKRRDEFFARL